MSFDQENPDGLWIGGQAYNQLLMRGAEGTSETAARYSILPAGHPQGYQDSFNAFVADAYAAVPGAEPDGLPTFADGLRAAILTQAVVDSPPAGPGWRYRMKLGFLTACLPHCAWRRSPAGRPTAGSRP